MTTVSADRMNWIAMLCAFLWLAGCASQQRGAAAPNRADGIFYNDTGGSERAIVFVHGWASTHEVWAHQMADVDEPHDWRLIAVDLPGHGASALPDAPLTMDLFADAIADVMNDAEVKQAVLVGHSYSGIVVGQLASQSPNLTRHTIFIEAFLPVAGQSLLEVSGLNEDEERNAIAANGGAWPAPSPDELASQPNLSDAQIKLLSERQQPHPGKTVTDPAVLDRPLKTLSASFIAHDEWLSGSREQALVAELKASESWGFYEIDGGHWPMLTVPRQLAELCHSCVI